MVQQPVNEFHLLIKALGYFRTHWWVFALEVLVIYGSSLNNYRRTPPTYESYASILIDNSRRQLYQTFMLPGVGNNNNARKQNLVHLLSSQEVMERLRNALIDHYNAEGRPSHLRLFFPNTTAMSANELRNYMILNWDRNSDIYSFRCSAENSDAAHDLCMIYMNTMQTYYPEIGQRDAMMKRDFLSRQISSLTRQISEREQNLAEFQKKSPDFMNFLLSDSDDRGRGKLRNELAGLKEQIATNRAIKRLLLNVPIAKRGEHTALGTTISALTTQLQDLQYQLQLMEQSNDPDKSERLKALNEEIASISAQLARLNDQEVESFVKNPLPASEVRQRAANLELEYRISQIKIKSVEEKLGDLTERERRFQTQRLEFDRLRAELNHRRRLLTNLYSKEQETEIELSAGSAEIFRLQEPTRATEPVAPRLSKFMYGSLSLCLFVIAVSTIFLMALFPRIDSEVEVNRLNLPVIGKVPKIHRVPSSPDEMPSFNMEYLKIMNYRILRETKDIQCPIIVVTSPHAREGKSTVTQLLCMASQTPNRKSLLIDGDLLTSRPNKFYGIQEDQTLGLRALLDHERPAQDTSNIIVNTALEGLSFMPRGERMDPVALPNFLKPLERVLTKLRQEYNIIYIDTPPLFASNLSHQWAGIADLIVLVARLYVTRPKDVTEAIQTCKIFSKAPVGVALNCVPFSGPERRASNYYFSRKKTKTVGRMSA